MPFGIVDVVTEKCGTCGKDIVVAQDSSGDSIVLEWAGYTTYVVWREENSDHNSAATESGEYRKHQCGTS